MGVLWFEKMLISCERCEAAGAFEVHDNGFPRIVRGAGIRGLISGLTCGSKKFKMASDVWVRVFWCR